MEYTFNCQACGEPFQAQRSTAKFCSERHRYDWFQAGTTRVRIPDSLRFAVLQRDGYRCRYCGAGPHTGHDLRVDHIVPVIEGGLLLDSNNLATACQLCNSGKGAALLEQPIPRSVLETLVLVLEEYGLDPKQVWTDVEDCWALVIGDG